MQEWALERQAELAPAPEPQPEPQPEPPPTAEQRSIEERFWAFFARVNPHLLSPRHFRVYVRRCLQAVGGGLRLVFSAPPQHGKTEVTLALIAFLTLEFPGRRWAYVTYNQRRANSVARKFKRLLVAAGVVTSGPLGQILLPGGGQILFTSVDGGITGEPVDGAAWIDDPFKNRAEADSDVRRATVEDAYREAIETRVHAGASLFVLATRWHPRDLSGVLIDEGWEAINLQAIAEGAANDDGVVIDDPNGRKVGEALFPEKWPVEELEKKRAKVLEFTWAALYQGRPRPRGGTVFHAATNYSRLPTAFRPAYGVDLAYTARTRKARDSSVCLELWRAETGTDGQPGPFFYVLHVDSAQVEAPDFALTLKARNVRRPDARMLWRASGTERGAAQFLQRMRLPLIVRQPPGDKYVAATEVAAAWNAGRVLVPDPQAFPQCPCGCGVATESWLYPFLDVVLEFTGSGSERDDEVDALGNAHALLDTKSGDDLSAEGARSDRR